MKYADLLKELYINNVRYLLCGGLAVNIYGIPRMTADIDILLDFQTENLESFARVTNKLEYKPSVPVEVKSLANQNYRNMLIEEKNMVALSLNNTSTPFNSLDIILANPYPFEEMWEKRDIRRAKDYGVNLLSLEQLIKMKIDSGRKQDKQDAENLKRFIETWSDDEKDQ
ncbi:MAG: nucleotidyl transferase AbiEii/AbiGii toxin family protein [Bacteroidales bacterium]